MNTLKDEFLKVIDMYSYDYRGYNRCDSCGLFMSPGSKGTSSFFVPDSELTHEDAGMRCKKCTEKFGEIPPSQGCVQKYCSTTHK